MIKKSNHLKSCLRLLLLAIGGSLLSLTVHAQDASSGVVGTNASLELKLTSFTPSLCIGTPIKLELQVTNVGNENVIIDMSKVWTQFAYSFTSSQDQGVMNGGIGIGTSGRPIVVTELFPGTTHQSAYEFALNYDFFRLAGRYELTTQLNTIFSNPVKFELYDCGTTQKIEDK